MSDRSGKVREPVLRLTAYLRAFSATSETGHYRVGNTEDPNTRLGQSVLRSPTVFNFYRPGYVPPGSASEAAGLAVPELQIVHETTAAGYVNYMRDRVSSGAGANGPSGRPEVQPNFTAELALASNAAELVERVNQRLAYGSLPAALKTEITTAVASITIRTNTQANTDADRRARVNAAVLLTLVSPEFLVQR